MAVQRVNQWRELDSVYVCAHYKCNIALTLEPGLASVNNKAVLAQHHDGLLSKKLLLA